MASHLISLRTIHRGTSQHIASPASMKFMSHLHVAAWTILEVGRIYFISSASWCPVRRSRRSWQMMDVNRNLKLAHWFHIEWPTLTNWHSRMLWCGRKSNCVGVEILWGTAIKGHCSKPWANRSSQSVWLLGRIIVSLNPASNLCKLSRRCRYWAAAIDDGDAARWFAVRRCTRFSPPENPRQSWLVVWRRRRHPVFGEEVPSLLRQPRARV